MFFSELFMLWCVVEHWGMVHLFRGGEVTVLLSTEIYNDISLIHLHNLEKYITIVWHIS